MENPELVEELRALLGADEARITSPCGHHFLILMTRRNTKEDKTSAWYRDGQRFDFDYLAQRVVASGCTVDELRASVVEYKRLTQLPDPFSSGRRMKLPIPTLDLHGKSREDAAEELDRFVDHEFYAGTETVSVVTGFGKGVLQALVREVLPKNPLVASWQELYGSFEVVLHRRSSAGDLEDSLSGASM
ncbi:MAG TPA: Smr/MutS family protein [Vicinamibacteria bacterium]|nr:Smr/MutS family protein [Vicinamibacteria bacterium]